MNPKQKMITNNITLMTFVARRSNFVLVILLKKINTGLVALKTVPYSYF